MTVLTQANAKTQAGYEVTVLVAEPLDATTLQHVWVDLQEAAALRPRRLVVDLSRCPYLDAHAIRLLVDIHQLIWLQDGRLVLRGAKAPVMRLLSLAGVLKVFALEDDVPRQVAG